MFAAVVEVTSQPRTALTVSNTGPGFPTEQVSTLFEPFRRLTADRTGHGRRVGLGLPIVRSITAAHRAFEVYGYALMACRPPENLGLARGPRRKKRRTTATPNRPVK